MAHLHFRCDSCDQPLRASPGTAGGKVKCPRCGALARVTASPPSERRPPEPPPPEKTDARPPRARSEETSAEAPPEADEPVPQVSPRVRRKRRRPSPEDVDYDPRYDRRNYPGWRKVRLGLLLLLIALPFSLPLSSLLLFLGMGLPLVGPLFFGLHFLPSIGYLLCTFVTIPGWPKRLAIANLGLAVSLLAGQAYVLLLAARASDPHEREQNMAKVQEQIQADMRAREEKIKERLKGVKDQEARKKIFEDISRQEIGRATRMLRLVSMLPILLWCLQVVLLACFLRSVAHFFKAHDLDNSCLVLIMVALLYAFLSSFSFSSMDCFLLPLPLSCLLLQLRLLVHIRRMIDDHLP